MTFARLNGQVVEIVRTAKRGTVLITTAEGKPVRVPGKEKLLQPGELCFVSKICLDEFQSTNPAQEWQDEAHKISPASPRAGSEIGDP